MPAAPASRERIGAVRARAYRTSVQRLRPLDETECYLRCYGWRGSEESVRVLDPREAPRPLAGVTAEAIRAAFEAMIDSREPEAA